MRKLSQFFMKAKMYVILLPISLMLIGGALNQAVLIANGGRFPVMLNEVRSAVEADENGYIDDHHVLMNAHTSLNWLADFIDLGFIWSPGDLLFLLGRDILTFCFVVWITLLLVELSKTTLPL